MKKSHSVTIILLCALTIIGWLAALTGVGDSQAAEYANAIEMAKEYFERGLFQKSAEAYENAVSIKGTVEDWAALLNSYSARYQVDEDVFDDYLSAAERAVDQHDDNLDFVMQLVQLYMEDGNYTDATKVLKDAVKEGLGGKEVEEALVKAEYAYEMQWNKFDEILPCVNGYYRVCTGGSWFYLDAEGSAERYKNVVLLGAVGEDDIRVIGTQTETVLEDEDGVVQGILPAGVEAVGIFADDLIPVCQNGKYAYYNILGDKQFGSYDMAGTFENGIAAVQANGKWVLIDKKGQQVSVESYSDVVLNLDGTCLKEDVIVAKVGSEYSLYDKDGKQIGDFSADAMDVVTEDGLIAYASGGKWGYVNTKGEVVVEPQFVQAKSFSNGLAAVYNGTSWGFIDASGKTVIANQFLDADYFTEEYTCMVKLESGWQMLEREVKG